MFLVQVKVMFLDVYMLCTLNFAEVCKITLPYCCQTATAFWWIHNPVLSDNTCHCRWGFT